MKKKTKLMLGDNIESLKKLPDNSIDSVVTDPPYGLSFMNKKWDYDVPSVDFWKEVYRVLKPGGHVLSFGGTRTYHRMAVNIEDAGFEIRDQIMWLYGSGFPKSHNISKAIDKNYGMIDKSILDVKNKLKELYKKSGKTITTINKECGFNAAGYIRTESNKPDPWVNTLPTLEKWKIIKNVINYNLNDMDNFFIEAERDVIGSKQSGLFNGGDGNSVGGTIVEEVDLTKSKTPEGKTWEGWGTALKPANEPICVARKPLSEKSVAENVLRWGTGGINIDGCRVGSETIKINGGGRKYEDGFNGGWNNISGKNITNEGRFPANIILECICDEVIKGEKGEVKKGFPGGSTFGGGKMSNKVEGTWFNDKGDIHTNPMCPCYMMDEQSGVLKSGNGISGIHKINRNGNTNGVCKMDMGKSNEAIHYGDKGGASRFFYQAKVSKAERNMGLDGIILQLLNFNILFDYNNKKVSLWQNQDLSQKQKEVMAQLIKKDIDASELSVKMESIVSKWNTELSGKKSMDLFQKDGTFITSMVINLITELKIFNVLVEQNTNENILECMLEMDFGGNYVVNVVNGNPKNIIIEQKKDGCQDNVSLVELEPQLLISVKESKNIHSTIKPVSLMAYLCRLITPQGGIVLDPYMGSGSTGIAAQLEGFRFVGMEMDSDYFNIAEARINDFEKYRKFIK